MDAFLVIRNECHFFEQLACQLDIANRHQAGIFVHVQAQVFRVLRGIAFGARNITAGEQRATRFIAAILVPEVAILALSIQVRRAEVLASVVTPKHRGRGGLPGFDRASGVLQHFPDEVSIEGAALAQILDDEGWIEARPIRRSLILNCLMRASLLNCRFDRGQDV
ncbi:hypothetical protein D3C81_1700170 [compost metagenome]